MWITFLQYAVCDGFIRQKMTAFSGDRHPERQNPAGRFLFRPGRRQYKAWLRLCVIRRTALAVIAGGLPVVGLELAVEGQNAGVAHLS